MVQLVGTVLFNLSTIDGLFDTFSVEETNRLVWAPDAFGSIAFLVASHLAWSAICRLLWCVHSDDPDWWVALANYVGSVFFFAAAIASFMRPTTGETLDITIVNLGTFLGAICFIIGSYLLLPPPQHPVTTAPCSTVS